jgi:pyruvate formate lyase activating enzyme
MNTKTKENPKARVLEIQRMSTEDGPGIRTTVFFKGCGLKCSWCHNPESISLAPEIQWIDNRCIGCRSCIEVCKFDALSISKNGISIDRSSCTGCGVCAEECPSTALELLGEEWTVDDLVREVIKDKAYFDKSGGGVTVSGGEPGLQPEFVGAFLKRLRAEGVNTALDTCGYCSCDAYVEMLPYASMVLFDIKETNSQKHREFTGAGNEKILENLIHVAEYIRSHLHSTTLWVRTPIIPGATDEEKNIQRIGAFIAENIGDVVNRWELCAFNNLCRDKYIRLGREWMFQDCLLLTNEFMEQRAEIAKRSGVSADIIHWTGSTRIEADRSEQPEVLPSNC